MDTIQFIDIFYHYSNINTKIITSIVYCILSKHWYPYRLFHKYVVKHKSTKLFMKYAAGKLEAALNISHLILSTSSQRVS